jgi:beta-lactamase class A
MNRTELRKKLRQIVSGFDGAIGIAVTAIESGDTLTTNNAVRYPMQSVYKFPLAIAVLAQVDRHILAYDQKVHITKEDLKPGTWSPMRDSFPDGGVDLTVSELLYYSVSMSDNNACDVLFRLAGGTAAVNEYIHSLGYAGIAIAATEYEMSQAWEVQFTNWCHPLQMAVMLTDFQQQRFLSEQSNALLMKIMTESASGPKRIKGELNGVAVAHKTGSSGTNEAHLRAAVNDAGIITMPNGDHVALVVFVSETRQSMQECEKAIAAIARAVYLAMIG